MELEQLIEALKACRNRKPGLTAIEKELGMPENVLSGMLSGTRKLPKKWIQPLTEYVEALKTEAKTASSPRLVDVLPPLTEEDIFEMAEKAHKSPPPGLTKSQKLRWHRENTQTLQ